MFVIHFPPQATTQNAKCYLNVRRKINEQENGRLILQKNCCQKMTPPPPPPPPPPPGSPWWGPVQLSEKVVEEILTWLHIQTQKATGTHAHTHTYTMHIHTHITHTCHATHIITHTEKSLTRICLMRSCSNWVNSSSRSPVGVQSSAVTTTYLSSFSSLSKGDGGIWWKQK